MPRSPTLGGCGAPGVARFPEGKLPPDIQYQSQEVAGEHERWVPPTFPPAFRSPV